MIQRICFLLLLTAAAALSAGKPNIIVIMADDMGYGDATCYGGRVATPNLDRMADEGLRFTDFHSSGNVCSPTRAGLLTGRYQQRAGVPGVINADPGVGAHWHGLQHEEITFAEILKEAGYSTALFGKWHLGYAKNFNPTHQGFDVFRGYVSGNIDYHSHYDRMGVYDWWNGLEQIEEEGYSTHLITRHALDFIRKNKNRPFCAYIAHEAVHSPWQGPNDPPQRGPMKRQTKGNQGRAFREMLIEMDRGVGKVLEVVRALGLAEKTFVFFLSDNGPAGGSAGPLRGRKGSNWEGGHRVPGIAWWPGTIPAGKVTDQLAVSLDLMPTMLAVAGVDAPAGRPLDGANLLPLLTRGETIPDRKIFWNGKAMRDGKWKLIIGGKGTPGNKIALYDLEEDIGEKKDLSDQLPERVQTMRQALNGWIQDVGTGAAKQRETPPE